MPDGKDGKITRETSAFLKAKEQEFAKAKSTIEKCYGEMEAQFEEKGGVDPEKQEEFDKIFEAGEKLRSEIERITGINELELAAKAADENNQPQLKQQYKSGTQEFIESEAFTEFAGKPQKGVTIGEVKDLGSKVMSRKGVYNSPTAAATVNTIGVPMRPARDPEVYVEEMQPLNLLEMIPSSRTDSTSIEQVIMYQRTNAADVVLDWDAALTPGEGDFGQKFGQMPLSDLAFQLVTTPLYDISHAFPVHRNSLKDNDFMAGLVDREIVFGLQQKLETDVLDGDGTDRMLGLLQRSGRQQRTHGVSARFAASDKGADTIRRAITDLSLSFFTADTVVLSPAQSETIELNKATDGHYINIYDPVTMRIWRVKVVENHTISATGGMVAAMAAAARIFYRQDIEIREGEPGNFFLQNAVAIAGNMRALLTVPRPAAICELLSMPAV